MTLSEIQQERERLAKCYRRGILTEEEYAEKMLLLAQQEKMLLSINNQ